MHNLALKSVLPQEEYYQQFRACRIFTEIKLEQEGIMKILPVTHSDQVKLQLCAVMVMQCKNSLEVTGSSLIASWSTLTCSFCTKFLQFWGGFFFFTPLLTFTEKRMFWIGIQILFCEHNTKLLLLNILLPRFFTWVLKYKQAKNPTKTTQTTKSLLTLICFQLKRNRCWNQVFFSFNPVCVWRMHSIFEQMEIVSVLLASKSLLAIISYNHYVEAILLKSLLSHHLFVINNSE